MSATAAADSLSAALVQAFPGSRPDTRRLLAATAEIKRYRPDRLIVRQGDDSSMFLVIEGCLSFRRTTVDGRQLTARVVTGGHVGGMLSLAHRPVASDAIAMTTCTIARWSPDELRALIATDSGLAADVLGHALRAMEAVVQRLDGVVHQNALRRVARVLHGHRALFFDEPPMLTRRHLPGLVGTSREMTGRVLRVLESSQVVIRVGRDGLQLVDPARLAVLAASGRSPERLAPEQVPHRSGGQGPE
jgi:CRP-like cAMP-binding protein